MVEEWGVQLVSRIENTDVQRRGDVVSMHHCAEHYRAVPTFKASKGGKPQ